MRHLKGEHLIRFAMEMGSRESRVIGRGYLGDVVLRLVKLMRY